MTTMPFQRALMLDVSDGSHALQDIPFPEVLGPVDFGLRTWDGGRRLCIGSGVLAGGIIPGSNRLLVCGHGPAWGGFYVSSLGGGALIWDGVGISFLAIEGRAAQPSVLVLQGAADRPPEVQLVPVALEAIWRGAPGAPDGETGLYALQRHVFEHLWPGQGTPRVLATGPSAATTAFGAIASGKTDKGRLTPVDCWAGRGGFGSQLLQAHNICAIVYGGDYEDEDLTDRAEADGYFQARFSKRMKLVDLEATTKYRYDPKFASGGTFGVNYSKLEELTLAFNYRTVSWPSELRMKLWERLVRDHYLRQFNEETIAGKQQTHCGEPCPAVCKKLNDHYKKDYEPYQAMGPLSGIFDQRAAERVNHHADALGFDGIQIGGQVAWVMECLHEGLLTHADLDLPPGLPERPVFEADGFDPVRDSEINAALALAVIDKSAEAGHVLAQGMRAASRIFGPQTRARAVYLANGAQGWMVPNQYQVPGMLAPQAVMGRYYTYYGFDFHPPRVLGRMCMERMVAELTTDNAGMCRFHRGWSEKLWPEIVQEHFGVEIDFPGHHQRAAAALHAMGQPVYWESARIEELMHTWLREVRLTSQDDEALGAWLARFDRDRAGAARQWWEELRAGIAEAFADANPEPAAPPA